jgi:3-oxo-5-alpha-steroid 4-dehydrogenase 1
MYQAHPVFVCVLLLWAGLVFAFWVAANLMPRARALHRSNLTQFPDYPASRKALIPYVW